MATRIAQNIRVRREACGLTQEQLAEAVGVSRQTIGKWEDGSSIPDLGNASALARTLDVSLDALAMYDEAKTGIPLPPQGKHLFGVVTLGERGQIVIPKEARDLFELAPGDQLVVLGDEEQGIAITKASTFLAGVDALRNAVTTQRKLE